MPGQHLAKVAIQNDTERPRMVFVEPFGEDFTLRPGERLAVIAWDARDLPWFQLIERDDCTQVWIETQAIAPSETMDMDSISFGYNVLQQGTQLHCGHQRQVAIDAGIPL